MNYKINMVQQKHFQMFLLGVISALLLYFFIQGMDSYFDRRDVMLCHSAKVSGNKEYLEKCVCFYKGDDIRCIYEGGDK